MKFGKTLKSVEEDIPQLKEKFVRYKSLKRKLKTITRRAAASPAAVEVHNDSYGPCCQGDSGTQPTSVELGCVHKRGYLEAGTAGYLEGGTTKRAEEQEFTEALRKDVEKLNQYFEDREEENVIKYHEFRRLVQSSNLEAEVAATRAELINFKSELVILLHWSSLNYAAVVKILKKHDKLTGIMVKDKHLEQLVTEPFLSTDNIRCMLLCVDKLLAQLHAKVPCGCVHETAADSAAHGGCRVQQGSLAEQHRQLRNALALWQKLKEDSRSPSTLVVASRKGNEPDALIAELCDQMHAAAAPMAQVASSCAEAAEAACQPHALESAADVQVADMWRTGGTRQHLEV